jgi:hypothetical protein
MVVNMPKILINITGKANIKKDKFLLNPKLSLSPKYM